MRLDRLLTMRKFGSRSQVSQLIKKGLVVVNEQTVKQPSFHIDQKNDVVMVDGVNVPMKEMVVLMMNKPSGVVSANKDGLHKTVFDLIDEPYHRYDLKVAGRLDIDTEGLMILTNDGKYIHQLISPKKTVFKTYMVEVDRPFKHPDVLQSTYQIKDGKGELYTPKTSKVEVIDDTRFYLSISEGKFHQVKRMVEHFGYSVIALKRISIGNIILDKTLPLGGYKEI